jgi:hypothetical protein
MADGLEIGEEGEGWGEMRRWFWIPDSGDGEQGKGKEKEW